MDSWIVRHHACAGVGDGVKESTGAGLVGVGGLHGAICAEAVDASLGIQLRTNGQAFLQFIKDHPLRFYRHD